VYMADGGGGGAPAGPSFTGAQRLHIEPSAIPEALKAFTQAHERVTSEVRALEHLPIKDWAGDPVSGETAVQFAQRSNTGGVDSAITCLIGYQKQLESAIKALTGARDNYVRIEGDNAALWGRHHNA
jgi:hypothetical protein